MPNQIHREVQTIAHCFNDIKTVKASARAATGALGRGRKSLVVQGAANVATAWAIAPVTTLIHSTPVLNQVPLLSTLVASIAQTIISDINPTLVKANDIQGWGEFFDSEAAPLSALDYAKGPLGMIANTVAGVTNPIDTSRILSAMDETDKVWRRAEGIPRDALVEMLEEVGRLKTQIDKLAKKANSAFDGVETAKGAGASVTPRDVASALYNKKFSAGGAAVLDYQGLLVKNIASPKHNFLSISRNDVLKAEVKAKKELYELERVLKNMLHPAVQWGAKQNQKAYARGERDYVAPTA